MFPLMQAATETPQNFVSDDLESQFMTALYVVVMGGFICLLVGTVIALAVLAIRELGR